VRCGSVPGQLGLEGWGMDRRNCELMQRSVPHHTGLQDRYLCYSGLNSDILSSDAISVWANQINIGT
jgi:hypothetical protein